MAQLLSDREIRDVLGKIIKDGADIRDSMERLEGDLRGAVGRLEDDVRDIRRELAQVPEKVREIVKDEQYRWLGGAAGVLIGLSGVALAAAKSPPVAQLLDQHGNWIGAGMAIAALLISWALFWRR